LTDDDRTRYPATAFTSPTEHAGAPKFRTAYTFLGGGGAASYPFWVTTIPESDYPWAQASSRRITVTVGP